MKKLLIISSISIGVIVVIVLVWYLLFPASNNQTMDAIRNGLPFGSGEDIDIPTDSRQEIVDSEFDEFGRPTATLFRIAAEPVAGAVAFSSTDSTPSTSSGQATTTTLIRYVDRATGHIYEVNPVTLEKVKISNQTMPKIYEAHWRRDGSAVLLRSLKEDSDIVENVSLTLTPPQATTSTSSAQSSTGELYDISASVLRGDIGDVSPGEGDNLFYVLEDSSSIVSSRFNGSGLSTIFSSPFNNWRVAPYGSNLLIWTKASSAAPGYAYVLNTSNGSLAKLLGPHTSLTAVPNPASTRVIYSYLDSGRTRTFVRDISSEVDIEILPATLAEKCVWSELDRGVVFCGAPEGGIGSNEPDGWYKGATHFSDRIWRFDTNTEFAELISEPEKKPGVSMDVSNPQISPNEDYLIFQNRNNLSLWALRLE